MDNDLLEKVIELSNKVGELRKENEMLKVTNSILEDKLTHNLNKDNFTEKELDVLINTIDILFDINKIVSDRKRIKRGKEKILNKDLFNKIILG